MNVPPLFIGLTLLFWGWEVKLLPSAVVGAVILELPRVFRWRWDFSDMDMRRVWDLCEILFAGAAVYGYATTDVTSGPGKFMPWLPLIFFPFIAATSYSAHDRVRLSTYFWLLRRKDRDVSSRTLGRFVPYWYFAVCFIAASIMNVRDIRFYAGVLLLGGWLLWTFRSRSIPGWAWAVLAVTVGIMGFFMQIGLTRLQSFVENKAGQILENLDSPDAEYTEARTAIGSVGKLQLSGRIILRVETDARQTAPSLLRNASFCTYQTAGNRSTWYVTKADFTSVSAGSELATWVLAVKRDTSSVATVSMFMSQGTGILPMPNGPAILEDLLADAVQVNSFGSVRVRQAPPLVRFKVRYGDNSTLDAPPNPADLEVPSRERPAVAQIAVDLGLASQSPTVILQRVEEFFDKKFTYSRYLKGVEYDPMGRNTALTQFLLHDHTGHCEYFATAATLLLRQAGIPARYAIGFAVPEEEGLGHVHLVRARHAHAWALAYVNGSWRDFDTTPATWFGIEDKQEAIYQPITDVLSWLRYHFARWRYYGERGAAGRLMLWVAPILLAWFAWRLFSQRRRVHLQDRRSREVKLRYAGSDSEFYLVERRLAQAGIPRRREEPLIAWVTRVNKAQGSQGASSSLRNIVALHYAYRFDPRGITPAQRSDLKSSVNSWLQNAS